MRKAIVYLCVLLMVVGVVAAVGCGRKETEKKNEKVSEGTLPEITDVEEETEEETTGTTEAPTETTETVPVAHANVVTVNGIQYTVEDVGYFNTFYERSSNFVSVGAILENMTNETQYTVPCYLKMKSSGKTFYGGEQLATGSADVVSGKWEESYHTLQQLSSGQRLSSVAVYFDLGFDTTTHDDLLLVFYETGAAGSTDLAAIDLENVEFWHSD